jgi:hypothetical protein
MTSVPLMPSARYSEPKLRLLSGTDDAPLAARSDQADRAPECPTGLPLLQDPLPDEASRVLIAGRDPAKRADVLGSLAGVMPQRTLFEEAGTFWEVLARAPTIRMVIISGELDGVPAESVLHKLGHRHPQLPVVSLDAPALATA